MSYKGSYTQQKAKSLALLSNVLHIGTNPVESLATYSDADWASYLDTRRSTSNLCMFLSNNSVSWSSKRQTTISRSMPKQSTVILHTLSSSAICSTNSYRSSTSRLLLRPLSIVTTSVQST